MGQFSIKNDQASELLNKLTKLTGQGKTETVIKALELYEASLQANKDVLAVAKAIRQNIHPYVLKNYKGKVPSKEEIEKELGMP